MKGFKILFLTFISLFLLTACDEKKETEEIEVQFLEYKNNYAFFVSHERKEYYRMSLTNYEEEFEKEKIEKITKITLGKQRILFNESELFYVEFEGETKTLTVKK